MERYKNSKGGVSYHIQKKIAILTRNYERIQGELLDKNIDLKRELSKMGDDLKNLQVATEEEEAELQKEYEQILQREISKLEGEKSALLKDKEDAVIEVKKLLAELKVTY